MRKNKTTNQFKNDRNNIQPISRTETDFYKPPQYIDQEFQKMNINNYNNRNIPSNIHTPPQNYNTNYNMNIASRNNTNRPYYEQQNYNFTDPIINR